MGGGKVFELDGSVSRKYTHKGKRIPLSFYSEIYLLLTGIDIQPQILLEAMLYPQIKFSPLLLQYRKDVSVLLMKEGNVYIKFDYIK